MENLTIFSSHVEDHVLEEYAFGRLSADEIARIEEHLLICPTCQYRLKETDEYILLVKQAARAWPPRKAAALAAVRRPPIMTILTAGLVTVAVAIAIPHAWRGPREPQTLELTAFRGGSAELPRAHAGELSILIDASNLDDTRGMRIEMVDAFGKPVWSGAAPKPSAEGRISARISARLRSGVYWVRLYLPGRELVREFGLRVE